MGPPPKKLLITELGRDGSPEQTSEIDEKGAPELLGFDDGHAHLMVMGWLNCVWCCPPNVYLPVYPFP